MLKLLLGVFAFISIESFLNADPGDPLPGGCAALGADNSTDSDTLTEALFLTPLLEDESRPRQEIRNMARVIYSELGDVESYSGFLTVNKTYNANLFFWYFPAEENVTMAPVLTWVNGGPDISPLLKLLTEMGPMQIDKNLRLKKRKYYWSRHHNVIIIDAPVGTGFSFADDDAAYATNKDEVALVLHEALMQLYELFEWNPDAGFWIVGGSYGAKAQAALAHSIHRAQAANQSRVHIPLKGLMIGNGFSDPETLLDIGDYMYELGLIDEHGLAEFNGVKREIQKCMDEGDMDCAFDLYDYLILAKINKTTLFQNLTGFESITNYLKAEGGEVEQRVNSYIMCSKLRNRLHVGHRIFKSFEIEVLKKHKLDYMNSIVPLLGELLDTYVICFYTGQLDILVPFTLTSKILRKLQFAGAEEYKVAERRIWYVDKEIAGYTKQAGNLIEVLVRNAGHMVTLDQPKFMHDLLYQVTHFSSVK